MKKNRTMRLAALLLVLVLMTSCFVGGTFAKYTSSATGTDTARVAKWSISVGSTEIANATEQTVTVNLFDTVCDIGETADDADVANGTNEVIIAPGTTGKFDLSITNNSEVNAKYSIAFTATNSNIPLEYSTDGGTTWEDAIADINVTDAALPMSTTAVTKTIEWRWAFEGKDSTNFTTTQTDESDTALGIAAQGTAPTVTVNATITATQVD